jgi:cardiolipin synthase (CMP-forming)
MENSPKVFTIPNGLTLLRALGIPIFLWLFLRQHSVGWSFIVLTLGAITDYFDGKVARWLNQESALGAAMDPTIDRAYIAATVIAMAIRDFIPWWLVGLLIARDLYMAALLTYKKTRTGKIFEVTFLGKTATFNLLYAFPFLLLAGDHGLGRFANILGWSFAIWGIGLYIYTAFDYTVEAISSVRVHTRGADER